jgi:hypothetical protein
MTDMRTGEAGGRICSIWYDVCRMLDGGLDNSWGFGKWTDVWRDRQMGKINKHINLPLEL